MHWIEQSTSAIGDWNPQLFRELKGRLTGRAVGLAIAASLVAQVMGLLYFGGLLPTPLQMPYHVYCTGPGYEKTGIPTCTLQTLDGVKTVLVNWPRWWMDVYAAMSWTLLAVALIGGVYLLISDLSKEDRTGTLNFIRTSPQSAAGILWGKLLGVPIIPVVMVAAAVPLHLFAAVQAQTAVKFLGSFYLMFGMTLAFGYSVALLFALLGGVPLLGASQGWLGASVAGGVLWMLVASWQSTQYRDVYSSHGARPFFGLHQYFGVVIDSRLAYALPLGILTLGISTYWVWQALVRRFGNPRATWLSKYQSYWATASFQLWLLGFLVYDLNSSYYEISSDLACILLVNFVWFMLLIAAMTPERQTLMDWSRYRALRQVGQPDGTATHQAKRKKARSKGQSNGISQWLWGEYSPALVAIAVNLLITSLIFSPWMVTRPDSSLKTVAGLSDQAIQAIATFVLADLWVMICAAIAQNMLFLKTSKRGIWAFVSVLGLCFIPPVLLLVCRVYPHDNALPWLFTSAAFIALDYGYTQAELLTSIAFQTVALIGLWGFFGARLRNAGASEWKDLSTARQPA
jgi:hypothetical protein